VPAAGAEPAAPGPRNELHGTVSLGRNRAVVGATILVVHEGDRSRVFLTATDAKGAFKLDGLPDGDYRVVVTRDGLEPVVKTGVSMRFPFRALLEIPMLPTANGALPASAPVTGGAGAVAVRARFLARGGSPVPDAVLKLRGTRPADPRIVVSLIDGTLDAGTVAAGRWRAELSAVGYLTLRATLDLAVDSMLEVVMIPQPAEYVPSPLDLMPPELPIPPPGLEPALSSR
jgi:hypothetical protein